MKTRTFVRLVSAITAVLVLTSCVAEDVAFLQAMADEWATAKKVNPQNKDGSINVGGLVNAGISAAGLPGGDADVTAAIGAKDVIDSINAADKEADDAKELVNKGDPNSAILHLNTAIKSRPNDWWLLNQRGVIQIEAGNSAQGEADLASATPKFAEERTRHQVKLLKESIARQTKGGGNLARCTTYTALATRTRADDAVFSTYAAALSKPGVTCK